MKALIAGFSFLGNREAGAKPGRVAVAKQAKARRSGAGFHDPVVRLEGAGLRCGARMLLKGVTADFAERRVAVIGRNGSGKSTLLRLMAGLVAPTEGRVTVNDRDPFADRAAMLSEIGILFQNPDHQILFPTVAQELAFGLRQQGLGESEAEDRVAAVLAAEGREDWADRPTHLLSQGQRQYLCLMAILLMRPSTVLLDEPFAGLDLPTRIRLERRLAALPQQVVIVTHDPRDALGCDRVVWIEAGAIVGDGSPADLLERYVSRMNELGACDADLDISG